MQLCIDKGGKLGPIKLKPVSQKDQNFRLSMSASSAQLNVLESHNFLQCETRLSMCNNR